MPLDSQQNNPPAIRINADGRITNIDEIVANIDRYSEAELKELLIQLNKAFENINEIFWQTISVKEAHQEKIPKLRTHIRRNIDTIHQWITLSDEIETWLLEDAVDQIRVEGTLIRVTLDGITEYILELLDLLEHIKRRLPSQD